MTNVSASRRRIQVITIQMHLGQQVRSSSSIPLRFIRRAKTIPIAIKTPMSGIET